MIKNQAINNIEIMIRATAEAKRNYERCLEGFTEELFLETFTYEDKELLENLKSQMSSLGLGYNAQNSISKALAKMKKVAHPEIDGVKYYKKYIDQLTVELTEKQKIDLDECIRKNYHPRIVYGSLASDTIPSRLENDILKELYDLGVIAPAFKMRCPECEWPSLIGHSIKGKTMGELFGLSKDASKEDVGERLESVFQCMDCYTTIEDAEWGVEESIGDVIKDAVNPTHFFDFKVLVEPDMTIDNL